MYIYINSCMTIINIAYNSFKWIPVLQ